MIKQQSFGGENLTSQSKMENVIPEFLSLERWEHNGYKDR